MADPVQLLRDLLEVIFGLDPTFKDVSDRVVAEANGCSMIDHDGGRVWPTYVLFDADGEVIGQGMSEDQAIADAVKQAYIATDDQLRAVREVVRRYRNARGALDDV